MIVPQAIPQIPVNSRVRKNRTCQGVSVVIEGPRAEGLGLRARVLVLWLWSLVSGLSSAWKQRGEAINHKRFRSSLGDLDDGSEQPPRDEAAHEGSHERDIRNRFGRSRRPTHDGPRDRGGTASGRDETDSEPHAGVPMTLGRSDSDRDRGTHSRPQQSQRPAPGKEHRVRHGGDRRGVRGKG